MKWSNHEVTLLKSLYQKGYKIPKIAKILGRTVHSINRKLERLGITNRRKQYKWTSEQISLLKKLYPIVPNKELSKRIEKSPTAIHHKARLLGLRKVIIWKKDGKDVIRWNEDEERLLLESTPLLSTVELAKILGRDEKAVREKLRRLRGVRRSKKANFLGREGEMLAIKLLIEKNWKLVKRGTHQTPYDFVVYDERGNKLHINVKHGKKMVVTSTNIRNLSDLGSSAFLFITKTGDSYLLNISKIE